MFFAAPTQLASQAGGGSDTLTGRGVIGQTIIPQLMLLLGLEERCGRGCQPAWSCACQ